MRRVVTDGMLEHASNAALFSFLLEARTDREFQEKQEKIIIDELDKRIKGTSISAYRLRCEHLPTAERESQQTSEVKNED